MTQDLSTAFEPGVVLDAAENEALENELEALYPVVSRKLSDAHRAALYG